MKIDITPKLILAVLAVSIFILFGFIYFAGILINSLDTFWSIILFSIIIIAAVAYDVISKKRETQEKLHFYKNVKQLLGANYNMFVEFNDLYKQRPKAFLSQNYELININNNFNFKDLQPLEILHLFASYKNLISFTDWKGEENEFEIENFLETLINKPIWKSASAFRNSANRTKINCEKFTVGLLKSIDSDLQAANHRLIFLNLGWDAYVYMCINTNTYNKVMATKTKMFYNVETLH